MSEKQADDGNGGVGCKCYGYEDGNHKVALGLVL